MNPTGYSLKEEDMQNNSRMRNKFFFVEEYLSRQFSNLGALISRHPFCFIILPIALSAILSTGLCYIKINRDFDYLLAATDGKAEQTKRLVQKLFPMNTSSFFDMPRVTTTGEFIMIVVTAKDGGSMLRENIFQEIKHLDELVRNTTIWMNGNPINYTNICGKRLGKCVDNSVLELAPHLKDIRSGKHNVKYPIYIDKLTFNYKEYIQAIGGVEVDKKGYLRNIKAIRLVYALDITNKNKIQEIHEWQIAVVKLPMKIQFDSIYISFLSEELLREEIKSYTENMLKRAPIVVSTIVLFSFFSCMSTDCVRSKQWLGPLSCISAGLAVASAIGFLCHLGVEYIDFSIILCYGVLTTEIDDAFILIASWRITDPKDTVETRMEQVFSQSVVSITITSLTTVLSFSIGISSTVPAIRICCIYGSCCCFFSYIYLLTFFGGCMALSGYREEKRLHPLTFRRVKENASKEDSALQLMELLRKALEPLLLHKFLKILVVVIFFVLLAFGIRGLNTIKYGNELSDGFNTNSPTYQTILQTKKYFGNYTTPVHLIFKEHLNYADPSVQKSIEGIMNNFTTYKHIAEPDLEMSWLKHYKIFQDMPVGKLLLHPYNMSKESDFVYALKNIFLKMPQTSPYNDDIFFNENYTKVVSSRFIFLMKDIHESETELAAVKDLYEIASKSPIPVELFSLAFHILESTFSVPANTAQLGAICCSLVCIVFILFAPNIPYALGVSAVVLCSVVEVIGLVSYWNVKLDYVTLITFSYSIGLCINYPSHMTFAILIGKQKHANDRRRNAFYTLAYPISQGCLSTVFGLLSVALHPHYISQSAFKVIFLISLVSTLHGLFTIPVFLIIFENGSKLLSGKNSEIQMRRQCTFEKSLLDEGDNEDKYQLGLV